MKAYQLKITLMDVEPSVWRRVIIPAGTNFKRLHDTIQFSMGWDDTHMFEFDFVEEKLKVTADESLFEESKYIKEKYKDSKPSKEKDPYGAISRMISTNIRRAQSAKIDSPLEKHQKFTYIYDIGDNWQHEIMVEKTIEDYPYGHPTLLDGEGACPPDDVGGPGGYTAFLEAWSDPHHPEHEDMRIWGESQYYKDLDIKRTNEIMENVLKLKKVK
ncbi:plasmid pRiA4b ORF-3 family protein [Lederbergia citrea]|uniref:Plasmid pRiA4b ORF-3 family protein n=1 Tax=Lederbergia citrea TaxID=2833581 RepID=A0A942Z587_9BACI|nr:plasmid pRiA4b ORF-3 family protein [Lederbergia citrea]MBS4223185.1 plasmid pRiA4b ORF-3 family protein [Lederbergia citrea]